MEEGQVSKTDGDDSKQKKTRTKAMLGPLGSLVRTCNINPEGRFLQIWSMMFVVSCLIAVSVDPLFLYLPIINEDIKCLSLDKRLKIIAYSLRSVTDFIYVLNIILQFTCPYIDEASRKLGRTVVVRGPRQIAKHYFFSRYFVIDVLAILPLPQVRDTSLRLNCFADVVSSLTANVVLDPFCLCGVFSVNFYLREKKKKKVGLATRDEK
jgi:hypothetical protein